MSDLDFNGGPVSVSHLNQVLADLPVLDTASALEMIDGDVSLLLMILPPVLKQMMSDRLEISSAVTLNDHGTVRQVSHRLKSSVGQIGAARAQHVCVLLERAAASGDSGSYLDLQYSLFSELDTLTLAINTYLAGQPTEST